LLRGVPFKAFARPRIMGNVCDGMAQLSELDSQHQQRRRAERERLASLRAGANHEDPLAESVSGGSRGRHDV
jgi:RNA polymerase sigma factor for flagellar operon FliA